MRKTRTERTLPNGYVCENPWHPSGCGSIEGVSNDYLMDVLPKAKADTIVVQGMDSRGRDAVD